MDRVKTIQKNNPFRKRGYKNISSVIFSYLNSTFGAEEAEASAANGT